MRNIDDKVRIGLSVVVLAFAPAAAMAYIDPGNGAYMVQALFTMVAAAIFYLRHPITSIKAFWRWINRKKEPQSMSSQANTPLEESSSASSTAQD